MYQRKESLIEFKKDDTAENRSIISEEDSAFEEVSPNNSKMSEKKLIQSNN